MANKKLKILRLPKENGGGYVVLAPQEYCIGYVYRSVFNDKWAAFSKYGHSMTNHIYNTPEQAANSESLDI